MEISEKIERARKVVEAMKFVILEMDVLSEQEGGDGDQWMYDEFERAQGYPESILKGLMKKQVGDEIDKLSTEQLVNNIRIEVNK